MPALPSTSQDASLASRPLELAFSTVMERMAAGIAKISSWSSEATDDYGLHTRSARLGDARSVNAAGVLNAQQRHRIQVLCCAMACISIAAALLAIYWFCLMRRNYRRDLVLMLILGDFYKSLWYVIYGSVTFATGQVASDAPFCQVSGFMLQVGLESCDMAILFISMHMALQIFPPRWSLLGHDGLYRVRHCVTALWILVPIFMASLAFINPEGGYQAQGAWCWLPVRPFWYRLALSYIPRYIIWIYIMGVAIRIYSHVGYEFRVFGQEKDRTSSTDITAQSSVARAAAAVVTRTHLRKSVGGGTLDDDDDNDVAPDVTSVRGASSMTKHSPPDSIDNVHFAAGRRASMPTWHTPSGSPPPPSDDHIRSCSNPASRRGSRQIAPGIMAEDFSPPPPIPDLASPRHGSISTIASTPRSLTAASVEVGATNLPPITEMQANASASTGGTSNIATRAIRHRRRAIQRQLRILFIYPIIYLLLWLIPMVVHFLSYSDHFAQHPIFVLSAMSSFCQTFMGFADVSVFCWRERPWRHVRGSDGTFTGSLCFWRLWSLRNDSDWDRRRSSAAAPEAMSEKPRTNGATGLFSSLKKRWSMSRRSSSPRTSTSVASARPAYAHKHAFSGGSDRKVRQADMAHERLALERADYEKNRPSLTGRRESVVSHWRDKEGVVPGQKEWFDRDLSQEMLEKQLEGKGTL